MKAWMEVNGGARWGAHASRKVQAATGGLNCWVNTVFSKVSWP